MAEPDPREGDVVLHGSGEIAIRMTRAAAEALDEREVADAVCNAARAALDRVKPGVIESEPFIPASQARQAERERLEGLASELDARAEKAHPQSAYERVKAEGLREAAAMARDLAEQTK
jgi:hypothetical protein